MHETAYLNPKLTIIYEDKRKEEVEHIEYHEPDGIIGFVKDINKMQKNCMMSYILAGNPKESV